MVPPRHLYLHYRDEEEDCNIGDTRTPSPLTSESMLAGADGNFL